MFLSKQCQRIQQCVSAQDGPGEDFSRDTETIHVGVLTFLEGSGERHDYGWRPGYLHLRITYARAARTHFIATEPRAGEARSERSQADGKMFLFSSLKLFIKGSLLLRVARLRVEAGEPARSVTREKGIVVS